MFEYGKESYQFKIASLCFMCNFRLDVGGGGMKIIMLFFQAHTLQIAQFCHE